MSRYNPFITYFRARVRARARFSGPERPQSHSPGRKAWVKRMANILSPVRAIFFNAALSGLRELFSQYPGLAAWAMRLWPFKPKYTSISRLYLIFFLCLLPLSCARKKSDKTDWQTHYQTLKASRKKLPIVVLDPGHGGESAGTKTVTKPVLHEKTLTLDTAKKVKAFLHDWGYEVHLTRMKDETVSLQKRVAFAKTIQGYLFVSIHFNHAPNPDAHGVEIFYFDGPTHEQRTERSKRLAKDLLRYIVRETDAYSRGVHPGNFHVIRENSLPAVLVEGGFCSHASEAKKLSDHRYLKKLAYAIARGIDAFIQDEVY